MTMATNECLHRFDISLLPTASRGGDYITVTRNSPLISAVVRLRPG